MLGYICGARLKIHVFYNFKPEYQNWHKERKPGQKTGLFFTDPRIQ